nr:nuclear pore complex protein Nup153-like isoform X3 [Procambarus clarkii]
MVSAGVPNMAMVNVNNFLNVKDSRWLQLEVCREFQRNKCTRPDTECKFAHPPPNVEVQNGRVTACYDSIKGRCNREKPPCKYFHPPQHLKDQLLINGRNHLALKNAIMTQIQGLSPGTPVVPGTIPIEQIQQHYYPCQHPSPHSRHQEQRTSAHYNVYNSAITPENVPIMFPHNSAPYLAGIPTMSNFNPYIASSPVMAMGMTDGAVASPINAVVPQQVVPAQKVPRTDRLEPGSAVAAAAAAVPLAPPPPLPAAAAAAAAAAELGKKRGRDPSDDLLMAFPGMVPYKRPAGDKSGVPVYQPTGSAAYQQALMQQLGGQSFVPVSCEYGGSVPLAGVGGQADTQDTTTTAANNHAAAASSAQPPTSSSSTTSTTTNSPSGKAVYSTSITATNSSSSTSSSSSTGGGELVPASPVPVGPQPSVNVFSYTGYSLSKGLRPQFKPPNSLAPTIMGPMALSSLGFAHPGMHSAPIQGFNYGIGSHMPNINVSPYASSSQQMMSPAMTSSMAGMGLPGMMHGIGGLTAGMGPTVGGIAGLSGLGASMPLVSPSILMHQNPVSSLYPPQYTALSSNTHYSLAQGGEQPNKRLKTS